MARARTAKTGSKPTVVPADPAGKRIESGGSTILCMAALAKRVLLRGKRIMVLHSGGDSRRLPAWSAARKIWVPLDRLGLPAAAGSSSSCAGRQGQQNGSGLGWIATPPTRSLGRSPSISMPAACESRSSRTSAP